MADANLITTAQVGSNPTEIVQAYTFQKNVDALLEILGIVQPIQKVPGTVLKTKKVTGTLQSGEVGEGETIPVSKYQIVETVYDTINLNKFAKQISIEAINEDPSVVELTNEEFCADIQTKIQDEFYTMLKKGSLVGAKTTFQAAVANAIGLVKNKFKKMHRTATGVAVFVNTIDLYDYLGTAQINLATEFGFEYVKNFLGADIVFISSEIPQNKVIATPLNNIKCYYIDPSDGNFSANGLVYTKWGATGYLGLHSEPSYSDATVKMFALCGLRLFAEYLDGIAVVTIGSASTQELGELEVTSAAGTIKGTTRLKVSPAKSSINGGYYVEAVSGSNEPKTVTYGMVMKNQSGFVAWDGKSNIEANSGKAVQVVEVDEDGNAVAVGKATSAVVKA